MPERAARGSEPAPAVRLGSCLWATTRRKHVRGAANLYRGLGVVGRGEPIFLESIGARRPAQSPYQKN